MSLPAFSVKRKVTTFMAMMAVIIFGVVSFSKIPLDLMPNIEIPMAVVSTTYQGAGPAEIESMITRPLEEAIGTVSGIKNLSSISSEGSSILMAEFSFGTDMSFASLDIREKIDLMKSYLPDGASSPMVMLIDINAQPIVQTAVTGSEDLAKLQSFCDDVVKPRLERIEGVASVSVTGGYTNVVHIDVDSKLLNGYGLTTSYLSQILSAENLAIPSGEVNNGGQTLTIRTTGEFASIDDIRNLLIPLPTGGNIRLSELAEVSLGNKDVTSIATMNGKPCINISVQKQSGTNTVQVAERVNAAFAELAEGYPQYRLDTLMDQSEYINLAINTVATSAVQGAVLAVIVLFLFLRNFRTTMIIGVSIPVSVVTTFVLLYFCGITLNMMTLGGFALGVGMMVDNSIVVLENIFRMRQEGMSRSEASVKGAGEVALAITASTITTIAVFLPMVFVEGMVSTIFRELALTVSMSLIASLVVALTIVPLLCSVLMPDADTLKQERALKRMKRPKNPEGNLFMRGYKRLLRASMRHRAVTVVLLFAVAAASFSTIGIMGAEYFPSSDQGIITMTVSLPRGSKLESTEQIVDTVVSRIEDIPELTDIYASVGGRTMSMFGSSQENAGSVIILLESMTTGRRSADAIADDIRARTADIPGAEIETSSAGTVSMDSLTGAAISVDIKGSDLDTLRSIADGLARELRTIEGAREVQSSLSEGFPEVQVTLKRENAARYGLTAAQVGQAVKSVLSGVTSTRLKLDGSEIDVIVRGDSSMRASVEALKDIQIATQAGVNVPLGMVADVDVVLGPDSISRTNQVRTVSVTGVVVDRDIDAVAQDVARIVENYPTPAGYTVDIGGQSEELNKAFADLGLALVLAVALIYLVLASQFESLILPIGIMASVPLGFAGGFLALFLAGKPFSVPAFIGVIMLAGIVVNNAIVLIDYINTRRAEGEDRLTAILAAGPIRLRPVLMTTLTTVLGLLPMAMGMSEGSEIIAPLAIVIIGGLIMGTVLTLVLIPVVYSLIDDLTLAIKRLFRIKPKGTPPDGMAVQEEKTPSGEQEVQKV